MVFQDKERKEKMKKWMKCKLIMIGRYKRRTPRKWRNISKSVCLCLAHSDRSRDKFRRRAMQQPHKMKICRRRLFKFQMQGVMKKVCLLTRSCWGISTLSKIERWINWRKWWAKSIAQTSSRGASAKYWKSLFPPTHLLTTCQTKITDTTSPPLRWSRNRSSISWINSIAWSAAITTPMKYVTAIKHNFVTHFRIWTKYLLNWNQSLGKSVNSEIMPRQGRSHP